MKKAKAQLIKKHDNNYRVSRPTQTGFSSPATHYHEPRIDLNKELVTNTESSFFIRVVDDAFSDINIHTNDVLIVDKSLIPKPDQLAVVISEGAFEIIRIEENSMTDIELWGVVTYVIKSVL